MTDQSPPAQSGEAGAGNRAGVSVLESLARAARQVVLYGREHPIAASALAQACAALEAEAGGEPAEVRADDGRLAWNGEDLALESAPADRFHSAMRERLIASITFDAPVPEDELARLFALLGEDPETLISAGGPMRRFNREEGAIRVEEVDFARRVRESEAAWADACREVDEPVIERLQRIFDHCLHTIKVLGDSRALDRIPASVSPEDEPAEEDAGERERPLQEAVSGRATRLIQAAGELAYFADADYWEQWRHEIGRHLADLQPEWRARVLRAPFEPSAGSPDILGLVIEEMDSGDRVSAVLDYPGAIRSERSSGLALVLSRVMPDAQRRQAVEPLLQREAIARGISEDVYRNVVELLMSEDAAGPRKADSSPDGAPDAQGDPRSDGESELADLLDTVSPEAVRRSHLHVLTELLAADLSADQYAKLLDLLPSRIQEYARQGDHANLLEALRTLARATEREAEEHPARRAMAATALERSGTAPVVAGVLSLINAPAETGKRELVALLGALGDEGMAAVMSLAKQPNGPLLQEALEVLVQSDRARLVWLRRLLSETPIENLRGIVQSALSTGDSEVVAELAGVASHPSVSAKLELIRLVGDLGSPDAAGALVSLLRDPAPGTRLAVVEVLGKVKAVDAVPALCDLARRQGPFGEGPRMKQAIMNVLGEIGSEDAAPLLSEELLRGGFWFLFQNAAPRVAAAEALGKIGGSRARETLERGRRAHPRAVREACERALARLSSPEGRSPEERDHAS